MSETGQDAPQEPTLRSMKVPLILVSALAVLFVLLPAVLSLTVPHPHGTRYDDPPLVEDFALPRADGGIFRLSEHRGKVVVLYFGYTSCPDVCPTTLFNLKRAVEGLGDEAEDLEVVFISIDWENDTPQKIADYLSYFNPNFIGLYGSEEQVQPVLDQFNVRVYRASEGQTAGGYAITHTTSMFVIDREGYLKLRMHHNPAGTPTRTEVGNLIQDLRYVLRGRI